MFRATQVEMAVLTHNRFDFKRCHAKNNEHFGIVICTENQNRIELAQLIHEKISEYETLKGELIRIYLPNK